MYKYFGRLLDSATSSAWAVLSGEIIKTLIVALASVGGGEEEKGGKCFHMLAFVVVAIGIVCQRRMDDSTEVSKDEKCEPLEKKMSTQLTVLLQELQFKISY